jgi:hypothetical protein
LENPLPFYILLHPAAFLKTPALDEPYEYHDYGDNKQDMYKSAHRISGYKPKQPKYYQHNSNRIQHFFLLFIPLNFIQALKRLSERNFFNFLKLALPKNPANVT